MLTAFLSLTCGGFSGAPLSVMPLPPFVFSGITIFVAIYHRRLAVYLPHAQRSTTSSTTPGLRGIDNCSLALLLKPLLQLFPFYTSPVTAIPEMEKILKEQKLKIRITNNQPFS
jgi:hypothetical protein